MVLSIAIANRRVGGVMSDTETMVAPPKPKAKPAQSSADKQVFAAAEKWMKVIREIKEESKSS
jgi:hypothetical protein